MAELTNLEDKLGEVIGLAQAAQGATEKIAKLVEDHELGQVLETMQAEARETEERGVEIASNREGKKTALLDKAGKQSRRPSKS